jgi:hypothetical protein
MLGRMIVQVTSARQLSYRAARLLSAQYGQMAASLAKLYASRTAEHVTRDALQLYGGIGYSEETDVSRYFQDARVLTIFEGAEEVLALRVIARALLADLSLARMVQTGVERISEVESRSVPQPARGSQSRVACGRRGYGGDGSAVVLSLQARRWPERSA